MTTAEIMQIHNLRAQGFGYKKISTELGLSLNTVKSFCKRNQVENIPHKADTGVCRQCGKSIQCLPGRKAKQYCSDECRMLWWNNHRCDVKHKTVYQYRCPICQTAFSSHKPDRKYCSRRCSDAAKRKGEIT